MTIRFIWIIVDRELPGYTLTSDQVPGPYLVSIISEIRDKNGIRFDMHISAEKDERGLTSSKYHSHEELQTADLDAHMLILEEMIAEICQPLKLKPTGIVFR